MSALKVSKVPFPVFGGEVRVVKENGKSQSLGVNTRCCQTRGREREGVAEDLTFVVIVVYLIEWVGRGLKDHLIPTPMSLSKASLSLQLCSPELGFVTWGFVTSLLCFFPALTLFSSSQGVINP